MPVFVRISATDWMEGTEAAAETGSWDLESTVRFAKLLSALGVDVLDVSSGGNQHQAVHTLFNAGQQHAEFAAVIRKALKVSGQKLLIGTVGEITVSTQARDLVQDDDVQAQTDFVLIGRQFLLEPGWVMRVASELGVDASWPTQIARPQIMSVRDRARIYQFSWAPNPYFPSFYTGGEHIYQYLKEVADQHDLNRYINVSHKILGARWIEERQKWQIQITKTDGRELVKADGQTTNGEIGQPFIEECDIFVNASGAYNNWRTDHVSGHTVTLIGNGSSGIQIMPTVLPKVDKVYVMLRSTTWITPALANRFAGENGANKIYTDEEKIDWSQHPEKYLGYRKKIEAELNVRFRLYLKGSQAQKLGREFTEKQMTNRLSAKPKLVNDLIPTFPVGGFLEALCSPKVEIIWGEIKTFNQTDLETTTGRQIDSDTIIFVGLNEKDLRKVWTTELPTAYLSVTVKDMPNYFVMMGPQSPLGHGSMTGSVEHVTRYMCKLIVKLQTEGYASLVPKTPVSDAWLAHATKWIEKTVWVENCASSFKNGSSGRTVVSLHPGSRLHYFNLLENPRYEDFEWTHLSKDPLSLFAWLGDGFTYAETHGTGDLA
ncbi:hypothetical protein N0V94_005617 [Neodidymelliopsis sp. IMI 364377]|nr:hypothetical protein N0V94_005617 [Neodidymelliopsis sp. IMI 364377]